MRLRKFGDVQDEHRRSAIDLGGCEFWLFRKLLRLLRKLDFPAEIAQAARDATAA
jgi:hypothetical protein